MKQARIILTLLAAFAGLTRQAHSYANPAPVVLLSSDAFAILAKTGISTSGTTLITGDIGVSPSLATSMTGFSESLDMSGAYATSIYVTGKLYAADYAVPTPAMLTQAVSHMEDAYTDAAGRAADATELASGSIGGLTLVRGVYKWGSNVDIASNLVLDGSASDYWIFQIDGNLDLASGVQVQLVNGALARNVFWQVAGQVLLQTTSIMNGNILCQTLIAMQNGATLNGKALAQSAVTLIGNAVDSSGSLSGLTQSPTTTATDSPTPTDTPSSTSSPTPSPTDTGSSSPTGTPSATGTGTDTPTPSPTNTGSGSPTGTPSATGTGTDTPTPSPSNTGSRTATSSDTPTASPSMTPTPLSGSATATPSATVSGTPVNTPVSPSPVTLGGADGYSVLAGTGISNTGNSSVNGYLGTFPTTTESGFGTLAQTCANHGGDAFTQAAKTDLQTAYNDLSTRPSTTIPVETGGTTLLPGVYSQTSLQLTSGVLTLDAVGNTSAVFIFYTGISTLTTAAGGSMNLINGALAKNVYWVVGSSATLGVGSALKGTIIALQSITLNTGATVEGRVLAINGAVVLDAATIDTTTSALVPCAGTPTPSATASPTSAGSSTATPSPTVSSTSTPTANQSLTATHTATVSRTSSPTPDLTLTVTHSPTTTPQSATPPAEKDSYIFPSPAKGDMAEVVYEMKEAGDATLKFYNQTGRLVDTLRETKPAGRQGTKVSVGKFAAGTYYYVLTLQYASGAKDIQAPRKFLVLH